MTNIPVYTCQDCGKVSTDKELFKILEILGLGFISCKECIRRWGE